MTTFDLIPAIDLRHGEVVRLKQGEDARRTVYETDPAVVVERYASAGIRHLHLVDLDAAFGEEPQRALLERIAELVGGRCSLQLGGGLRDRAAFAWAAQSGFSRFVVTSLLVKDFDLCADVATSHPGALVPALDLRAGELKMSGWTESADVDLGGLCARLKELPIGAVLVTDIERDGMLDGPNVALAAEIGEACGAPGLLSGGVRTLEHLQAALAAPGVGGAIVGRALLDGVLALDDALSAVAAQEINP
ncbi:MAG: 1-(5-phosphoribosyl)-5-[(5-phosphoribosylamino)methylideneamino] imidazole-4-carboxamide isomerase [Acidobacteriota bacterium]